MGRHINLDFRSTHYDRYRGAFIVSSGSVEVAIVHEAIEAYAHRSLSMEDAQELLEDQKVPFSRMANSLTPDEGIITITPSTVTRRSWDIAPAMSDGGEE